VHLQDVVFTGLVNYEEQPSYYRTADIFFAHPPPAMRASDLILLEAMATGRPIVATNIEGFAAVVTQGEEGLLVPPMTVHSLAEAFLKLLNDRQLRLQMGQKGLVTAQKYTWEGIAARILAYYSQTIEKVHHNGAMR